MKCSTTKSLQDKIEALRASEAAENNSIAKEIFTGTEETENRLEERLSSIKNPYMHIITDEAFDKLYGNDSERNKLADKLWVILNDNPQISEFIKEEIMFDVTRISLELPSDAFSRDENGVEKLDYSKLPVASLRKWINKSENWANSNGADWNSGWFQFYNLEFGLPKNLRFKEPSGAYANLYIATQRYADGIANRISRFMHAETETFKEKGLREFGMADVLANVEGLWNLIDNDSRVQWAQNNNFNFWQREKQAHKWFLELFTMMMHGQIEQIHPEQAAKENQFNDGEGLYVYTQWAPTGDLFDTGDAVFKWQRPIKLETYDPKKHGDVGKSLVFKDSSGRERLDLKEFFERNIDLSSEMIESLGSELERARVIDIEVFEYVQNQMQVSFNVLLKELDSWFEGIDRKDLRKLFTYEITVDELGLSSEVTYEVQTKFNYLEDNFTKGSLMTPFILEGDAFQYKESHWPAMFGADYPIMLKEALVNVEAEIEQLIVMKQGLSGESRRAVEKKLRGLKSSRKRMDNSLSLIFGVENKSEVNDQMLTRRNSKYMKHITNAFDMLRMRKDKRVYYDSLEHHMRAIGSNFMTADLLKSIRLTDEVAVKDAMIALFKRTAGRRDARASIFGIKHSDEGLSPKTEMVLRALNNAWIMKLAGPGTALTNLAGIWQKVLDSGMSSLRVASSEHNRVEDLDGFKDLIRESGVIEFSEFYASAIVKELEDTEVKKEEIYNIIQGILEYYNNRNGGMNRQTARNKLEKIFLDNYKRGIDWNALLGEKEARNYSKKMKHEKILGMTSKLVNFAINREYEMRAALRDAPGIVGALKRTGPKILEVFALLLEKISMSRTEKYLREVSFIMGVMGLQGAGRIKGNIENLSGDDRILAIRYGRKMTREILDFGMSSNDAGEQYASIFGKLMSKFSIWKNQKMSADKYFFKNAYESLKDDSVLGGPMRTIWAMASKIGPSPKNIKQWESLWTTHPDAARLRAFLYTQGIVTLLTDLAMTSIGMPPALRAVVYHLGLRRGNPAGSSFMSWAMLIPLILIKGVLGWDDDEDKERMISYYVRQVPYGMGFGLIYDFIILAGFWDDEKKQAEKIEKIIESQIPLPSIITKPLKEGVKATARALKGEEGGL